jgi:tRNA-dihydrouridine synthase A
MNYPEKVANLVQIMKKYSSKPITVKCRLGVDDLDSYEHLQKFIASITTAGVTHVIVHARKVRINRFPND